MRLSLDAIKLCETKLGERTFFGFEQLEPADMEHMTRADGQRVFDELAQAELIEAENNMHISALGQHIFYMMSVPDQYIRLENEKSGRRIKIYIRDTYYLCIVQEQAEENGRQMYRLELLPLLDLVVSAFAYALSGEEEQPEAEETNGESCIQGVVIEGKAWNRERTQMDTWSSGKDGSRMDRADVVNALTIWMFQNMRNRDAEGRPL